MSFPSGFLSGLHTVTRVPIMSPPFIGLPRRNSSSPSKLFKLFFGLRVTASRRSPGGGVQHLGFKSELFQNMC